MAKSKGEVVPAAPTDKELVTQRIADANAIVADFVSAIFGGVQGKVADLRADLEAGLAAARVRDAQVRLDEIHAEVQKLADEAAAATTDITFRLAVTQIAILKGSFAARYAAAVGTVPGVADSATIQKEVNKLFDTIVADIKARRRGANLPPENASGEPTPLDPGHTPVIRELAAAPVSTGPSDVSSAADPEPSSADPGGLADMSDEALAALAAELAAEDSAREATAKEEGADAGETVPAADEPTAPPEPPEPAGMLIPQVGLPNFNGDRPSKHKSKNGFRHAARA